MPYTYQYPHPCVTVDIVVFRATDKGYCILLIKRKNEPFKDAWALPGGFIEMQETLEESAARELREETGLTGVELHQLGTFGDPDRDPRGRTITVAYYALDNSNTEVKGEDDAADAQWFPLSSLPSPLAFDHDIIINTAINTLSYLKK